MSRSAGRPRRIALLARIPLRLLGVVLGLWVLGAVSGGAVAVAAGGGGGRGGAPQQTAVTRGSVEYSNISRSIDYLKSRGHTKEAAALTKKLNAGEIYFDPTLGANAETSLLDNITIDGAGVKYNGARRRSTAFAVGDTGYGDVLSLARTLFHELRHVNQSGNFRYNGQLSGSMGGPKFHEAGPWAKTIDAMKDWLEADLADLDRGLLTGDARLALLKRARQLLSNLSGYMRDWQAANYHGQATSFAPRLANMKTELDRITTRLDGEITALNTAAMHVATNATCMQSCLQQYRDYSAKDRAARNTEKAYGQARGRFRETRSQLKTARKSLAGYQRKDTAARSRLANATSQTERMNAAGEIAGYTNSLRRFGAMVRGGETKEATQAAEVRTLSTRARTERAAANAARALYDQCRRTCLQGMLNSGALEPEELPPGARANAAGTVQVDPSPSPNEPRRPTTGSRPAPYKGLRDQLHRTGPYSATPEQRRSTSARPTTGDAGAETAVAMGGDLTPFIDGVEFDIFEGVIDTDDPTYTDFIDDTAMEIGLLANPLSFNPISGGRDPLVQLMMIESFDSLGPVAPMVFAPVAARRPAAPWTLWDAFGVFAADRAESLSGPNTATVFARRAAQPWQPATPAAPFGPAGPQGGDIQVFLTSLGTSTGEAITAQVFNFSNSPVRFADGGIVVQPLEEEVQRQLQQLLQSRLQDVLASSPASSTLNAYCLELLRAPPSLDAMFQIAGSELQAQFAPMGDILAASRRLQDAGLLNPDSDPLQYFHSLRQWAVWSEQEAFDIGSFTEAFVGRTRDNLADADVEWSDRIESGIRGLAPGRWQDIVRVLGDAGLR